MKAAAKRQMEYEKLQERKVHKERESEGDLWQDKETFVTSAYRRKMEERQLIEDEERRQEQVEALLDVRKQRDLSGFYSSMLKMRTGEMVVEEEGEKDKRVEATRATIAPPPASQAAKNYRTKREENSDDEDDEIGKETQQGATVKTEYSETTTNDLDKDEVISDEDSDTEDIGEAKLVGKKKPLKLGDEHADPHPGAPAAKKPKSGDASVEQEAVRTNMAPPAVPQLNKPGVESKQADEAGSTKKLSKEEARELRRQALFAKRTVGQKFEQELSEYFARKSTLFALKTYIERE